MADSVRHAVGGCRVRPILLTSLGVVAVLGTAAVALATVLVARVVVIPRKRAPEPTRIVSVDLVAATVTLGASEDARLPGRYGLWFSLDSGHAKLGEIMGSTGATVTRRILDVDFGNLAEAVRGRFSGWFYVTPQDLGHPFEEVSIETTAGGAPAWLIPADSPSTRWVVQVHGRGVKRSETLRAVNVFRDAGYNTLVLSWRNDGDAPASADGRYGLGGTEWLDVEAGVRYLTGRGATDVVLMGWSMGGAIALQTATRSSLAGILRGIVLESPVVDWAPTIHFQAGALRVPLLVRLSVLALLGSRRMHRLTGQHARIDFPALDFVRRVDELSIPILVMHSDDDGYVPSSASRAMAVARPDIVTFSAWKVARHTKLWNYDSARFDRDITEWLAAVPLSGTTGVDGATAADATGA